MDRDCPCKLAVEPTGVVGAVLSIRTRLLQAAAIAAAFVAATAHADGVDPDITVRACLAAVAEQAGSTDLTALGKDYSEANSAVLIGVGPDQAPWRCLVSNDGVVAEVRFTGAEDALPAR